MELLQNEATDAALQALDFAKLSNGPLAAPRQTWRLDSSFSTWIFFFNRQGLPRLEKWLGRNPLVARKDLRTLEDLQQALTT